MKKLLYTFVIALIGMFATKAHAQYTITYHTIGVYPDSICVDSRFDLQTSGFSSGLMVQTYYGDGTDDVNSVMSAFVGGYATYAHTYTSPGVYTVKQLLLLSGVAIDSVISSYDSRFCQTFCLSSFYDANSNCIFDSATETYVMLPLNIAVDSNGVRIDTFVATSGLRYQAFGNPGDVYAFRVISLSPGIVVTCPASGVIYDTVSTIVNDYIAKSFGFNCSGTSGYEAGELVTTRAGRHRFIAQVLVTNQYCTPTAVTLTVNMSPKYNYIDAYPIPTSVSGHTITWTFPALSAIAPQYVFVHGEVPGTLLTPGDTAHSSYYLTPLAGDSDTSNNSVVIVDTVTGSWDPNDKGVSPKGFVAPGAGTKLTYTLRFENTGNDTALNIHIMDTLSNNLDVRSLAVLGSSAAMNLSVQNIGGLNVVKFDFPAINLLDSTHHGQCDGMVTFTIKTKDGLALGTHIDNRAGIYFDYNAVVMTNTVTSIIGTPTGIEEMSNGNAADVTVFPNPASSELTVNINRGAFSKVSIVNSLGQQVFLQDVDNATTKLNIKSLPAGTYYISVRGESGVKTQMFQKM